MSHPEGTEDLPRRLGEGGQQQQPPPCRVKAMLESVYLDSLYQPTMHHCSLGTCSGSVQPLQLGRSALGGQGGTLPRLGWVGARERQ